MTSDSSNSVLCGVFGFACIASLLVTAWAAKYEDVTVLIISFVVAVVFFALSYKFAPPYDFDQL